MSMMCMDVSMSCMCSGVQSKEFPGKSCIVETEIKVLV